MNQTKHFCNKIAILLPDLRGGGAERISIDLAHQFKSREIACDFLLMRAEGEFLSEAKRNFTVVELKVTKARRVPSALARYLRTQRPDALIANMWPLTSMAVISLWLSMTQTRLLLVEHNTLSRQYASCGILHSLLLRASLRLTYRFANYVAAVSSGAAVDTANLAAIPVESVKVLHNPIPLRRLPNPEAKQLAENLWNCPAGQRILTVGSLKAQKNHALLLRGFKAMSDKDVHLMILGSGDQEPLRHLALELGILDRVVFAGFHVDPTPFYATADLFVLSSNYEGFGNVIVEALSFGLPIVSTDCPSGPAEILENGKWGTLVPVGDVTALAQAMAKALVAPVNHAALKRRAADFSPEIAAQKYVDLLGLDSRSR